MIKSTDAWLLPGGRNVGLLSALFVAAELGTLRGQVVLDGKFGSSGTVAGPAYNIKPEMGAVRGNNLFHSFQQFDLKTGDVASFSGPANIQNILTRVTGGAPSSIDGTIRSEISGANFFLINPHGLIFGPNASVDVSGAFASSSADYLKLADGARFVASLDADDSALSTAPVSAFGFLGSNPGTIELQQSKLQVQDGQSVSLVGGEIALDGSTITAPAGQINAVSVKSSGEVPVDPAATSGAEFLGAFAEKGSITLRNQSKIDASGEGGGRIVIRGGSLALENSKVESNTTGAGNGRGIEVTLSGDLNLSQGQINSVSVPGLGASGNVDVTADSVRLDGAGLIDEFFNPAAQIATSTGDIFFGGGPAKGGDISIHARNLELVNSAQISAATYGSGDGGRITIEAADSLKIDAMVFSITQISANSQQNVGGGKAGDVLIKTGSLELRNGATIVAATFGDGAGGVISIDAQSIYMRYGTAIAAPTFGLGVGGNISVKADSIRLDGSDETGASPDAPTGIQAVTSNPVFGGPGGNIEITTRSFELDHMGGVFTSSANNGKGGNIAIKAGNITMDNASTIRAEGQAEGAAGTISIQSDKSFVLTRVSSVTTSAPLSSGGDITVKAGSEVRLVDSEFNAQAGLNGGNISVSAADLIYLLNSKLTAQADTTGSGFGNGGNLTIDQATFLILNNSGLISKSSFGNGGNITILSDYFFESESLIDASAPFGLPGTVIVTAPQVDLSGILVALPGNLLDAATLLRPDCAIRLAGNVSSFIVLGRGGLPIQPGGFLPSGMAPQRNESQ